MGDSFWKSFVLCFLVVFLVGCANGVDTSVSVTEFNSSASERTADILQGSSTMFDELGITGRDLEIDLVSEYGTSSLRDIVNTSGSGEVPESSNQSTGELMLRTGNVSNSSAVLETANLGRYSPGEAAQAGIGLRTLDRPVGGQEWMAGYFGEEEGFFFGENSSCLYVAIRKNGVDEKYCRSEWNGENISEALGRDWSPDDGTILQIDYTWYGFGAVKFSIVETKNLSSIEGSSDVQDTVVVHSITSEGSTSIRNPMQRLRVEVNNGNTSENYEVRVGGRQYSVYGGRSRTNRIINTGVARATVDSTDFTCLSAMRKDSNRTFSSREIQFYGMTGLSSAENVEIAVFFNPNVTTTGSFENPNAFPPSETALRVNKNCSFNKNVNGSVTFDNPGGLEVWSELIAAGSQGSNLNPGSTSVNDLDVKLPVERGLAVGARVLNGGTTTVDVNVRFSERR